MSTAPPSGILRHRVAHQRATLARDSVGQMQQTWSTIGTYWAFVEPLQGRSLVNAAQVRADVTHKVTMRYLGTGVTITPQDRLLYKGRVLEVAGILNVDERNRGIAVYCTETKIKAPTDTLEVYYGTSAATTLNQSGILALPHASKTSLSFRSTYTLGAGDYKYLALPASYVVAGVTDNNTGWEIDLAGVAEGYTSVANGIHYLTVSVSGNPYRVYRSHYILGGAVTVAVR